MSKLDFNFAMSWIAILTLGGLVAMFFVDPGLAMLASLISLPALFAAWFFGAQ